MTIRNRMLCVRAVLAAVAVGSSALMAANARAAIIAAGTAPTVTPGVGTLVGLTQIADETYSVTAYDISNVARYTASVESRVYRDPTGTLDFAYRVTNTTAFAQPDSLHTVSLLSFRNFSTDVDYVSATGNVAYNTVTRPATFGGLSLSFDYTPAANAIAPSDATDWMLIKTNARAYDNLGQTTLIDGATANVTSFEPAVPEPMSLGLFITAGAAMLMKRRGRRIAKV